MDQRGTHFTPLNKSSKKKIISLLSKSLGQVEVWKKGAKEKEVFNLSSVSSDLQTLFMKDKVGEIELLGEEILTHFSVKGIHYFMSSKLEKTQSGSFYRMKIAEKIFKCERRKNYRIKVPMRKGFSLTLTFNRKNAKDGPSELSPYAGEETKLFNSFLNLVSGKIGKREVEDGEEIDYGLFDLSASGVGFLISQEDVHLIEEGALFGNVQLSVFNQKLLVNQMKVIHINELPSTLKDQIRSDIARGLIEEREYDFKVGSEFVSMRREQKDLLEKIIHGTVQRIDSARDFEDFIS